MSNRRLDRPWCVGERLILVCGSFVPLTGAGTVVASTVKGLGFGYAPNSSGVMALRATPGNNPVPLSTPGITRVSAGLYSIVFEDPYLDVEFFDAILAGPATGIASGGKALSAQPVEPVAGLATANKAPTAQVVIVDNTGTPTEGIANCRLYFELWFRDSTAQYAKP